nr:MAG TPA: hypothetical protein [Caudoviricetes sp.]
MQEVFGTGQTFRHRRKHLLQCQSKYFHTLAQRTLH